MELSAQVTRMESVQFQHANDLAQVNADVEQVKNTIACNHAQMIRMSQASEAFISLFPQPIVMESFSEHNIRARAKNSKIYDKRTKFSPLVDPMTGDPIPNFPQNVIATDMMDSQYLVPCHYSVSDLRGF